MLRIKPGVRLHGVKSEVMITAPIISDIMSAHGLDCTITSGIEGAHKRLSRHREGDALDYRTRHIPGGCLGEQAKKIHAEICDALGVTISSAGVRVGGEYDVILEHNHIHVEWQPM